MLPNTKRVLRRILRRIAHGFSVLHPVVKRGIGRVFTLFLQQKIGQLLPGRQSPSRAGQGTALVQFFSKAKPGFRIAVRVLQDLSTRGFALIFDRAGRNDDAGMRKLGVGQVRDIALLIIALMLSAWFAVQFVLAEKKMNVYVFPSLVTTDGFANEIQALGQDLSPDAELVDFNRENSAFVFLGATTTFEVETLIENDINDAMGAGVVPSLVPSVLTPDEVLETPVDESASSSDSTNSDEATSTTEATEAIDVTDAPGVIEALTASSAPAVSDEVETDTSTSTSPTPSAPPVLDPAPEEPASSASEDAPTPLENSGTDAASSAEVEAVPAPEQQTLLSQFLRRVARVLDPHVARAQDLATTSQAQSTQPEEPTEPAAPSPQTEQSETIDEVAPEVPESAASTSTKVTPVLVEEAASSSLHETDIEIESVSTSTPVVEETFTPMSSDPYTVLSCKTQGITCRMMEFTGFGLGGALDEHPLQGATVEISLAGRGNPVSVAGGEPDRILVRAYHAGRWEFLGEFSVIGEFSNAKRGGYFSLPLENFADWGDLNDLKIVLEYVHEGATPTEAQASVYVDGLWINAEYDADSLGDAYSPETLALSSHNLRSALLAKDADARKIRRDILETESGEVITFVHAEEHANATLAIKSDKSMYHELGNAETYFNVTNESDSAQVVRLQFYFPNDGGDVTQVSRYTHGIPYKIGTQTQGAIGYFCALGWMSSTSTGAAGLSVCPDTEETRMCDAFNDDNTNCILEGEQVGIEERTEYRAGWSAVAIQDGSFRDTAGLFAKAIDAILNERPEGAIPSSQASRSHLNDSFLLPAGATAYFRADLEVPLNGRGEFYVEAAAEGGAYGLLHAGWDGSWNYRVPVDIDNEEVNTINAFAIPVALENLPESFWSHIAGDGSDLRFVDEDAAIELPYWLASFDHGARSGLAWVRVPKSSAGTTTRIFAYAGDENAKSQSDEFAPFRTTEPVPRAVVFGGSARDMTLHVIAQTENTHVQIDDHDDVWLKQGEHALFANMAPGMQVYADAPLALAVDGLGASAGVVPMGFAGMRFVVPGIGDEREIAVSVTGEEVTHATLSGSMGAGMAIDPIKESIVKSPIQLSESLRFDANIDVLVRLATSDAHRATPLYPSTRESLYGVAKGNVVVGFGTDASRMTAVCSSSPRKDIDGRRAGMTTTLNHCMSGLIESVDAVRVQKANHPIATLADDEGHLTAYIPKSEFAASYVLTEDASRILLVCDPDDGEVHIGLFDAQKKLFASTTCAGMGERPGKKLLTPAGSRDGTVFPLGSVLRSISADTTSKVARAPFMALASGVSHDAANTEQPLTTLYGAPLYRPQSPNQPKLIFGVEEFVVPGEHRVHDVDSEGNEKPHVNKFLSKEREFSMRELPSFAFQYTSQSGGFMRSVREAFGVAPFTVAKVALLHPSLGEMPVEYDIAYGANNEWSLSLRGEAEHIRPGKYTLHVEITEGGDTYIDEYDFYWGVLAINYNKSIFTLGETMDISMAALSDNGNTICDARLKLWITTSAGIETEAPVSISGQCDGNNVTDVPDYSAIFTLPADTSATGTYKVKLVRLDDADNAASQVVDTFEVRASVPYSVERVGPTRIYPVAHYAMKIRVRANVAFEGDIVERVPGDFVMIDRGNGDLEWGDPLHAFMTATWNVKLAAGQVMDLEYVFDAPDRSPYLYLLGPLTMKPIAGEEFAEARQWQIASDAVGKMIVFWDSDTSIPTDWTCLSCIPSDVFYQRLPVGSTTYGGIAGYGGTATHTPTALGSVYATTTGGVGPNTTNNTNNAILGHTHSLTPTISGVSNLPNYRSLRVIQHNNAGEPALLPAGVIVAFDIASSSLPLGWNRYGAQDGYYAYAASSSAVVGGANTHAHTATGTTSAPPEGGRRSNNSAVSAADNAHTHQLSTTTTDTVNNEPPYIEILFAQLSVSTSTLSNYMITMWDDEAPAGWALLSGDGGALNGRFLKASTTYGTTGGSSSAHTHVDIVGATTTIASSGNVYNNNGATNQAPTNHFHAVDVTGFSTDSAMPPSIDVVFAKRLSGIVQWTQNSYRIYDNQNANTPTDPWPPGGSDLSEDSPIDASTVLVKPADDLRIRINLGLANATATPLIKAFKLQYVASTDCANALNWTDVGAIGSGEVWRGYNNTGVTDGAAMSATLLSTSDVAESYVEANNSPGIPNEATTTQRAEWDWVIQDNSALASTNYCFRMVLSDGTPLDTYTEYPQILTNGAPNTTTLSIPFDNEKVGSTTPDFNFSATDPDTDDLDYQIQVDTSTTFLTTVIDFDSTVNPELFDNITDPANKAPFTQGEMIHYKPTSGLLVNGTTYWWRVRAKDPNGSNSWGEWATMRSFTVDTTVVISTWHQTTSSQFETNTLSGVNSSSSDHVMLDVGSTTGTIFGTSLDVSQALIGTVWGVFSVSSTTPPGTFVARLEYFSATGTWDLIPDSALPGNSTGLRAMSNSLLSVDSTVYEIIRPRADFTNSGGTPILLDWTIAWGYNVVTPTLYIPFDNAKSATTTPYFEFMTTDPQGDSLTYELSWSTSSSFTSSTTVNSATTSPGWENLLNPVDTDPFDSGGRMRYTIQSNYALGASSTYFWKVRARDPAGANNYSFWSDIRSHTVDLSILAATWFQTAVDQFTAGSLTSIYEVSTTSLTVATTTDEVMLAYGEGSVVTPRYRIWDGTSLGGELSALSVGAQIVWVVLKASPLIGQYILATLGTDRDINYQVYESGSWGNQMELLTTAPSLTRRSFDVAYQTLSGEAIAVSCDGSTDAKYQIWDGSAWAATGTIDLSFTTNCEWVRMASSPITNEVIALFRNTGTSYEAQVWNATSSTWGDAMTMGSMAEIAHEGMAVEYEMSGNQAVVVTSNGTNASFLWNVWDGSAWAGSAAQVLGDDFEWGNLRRNTGNDDMVLCYVDQDSDIGVVRWTGSGWVARVELETLGVSKDGRPVDCQYETLPGRTNYIMIPYSDTAGTRFRYWDTLAYVAEADINTIPFTYTSQLVRTAASGTMLGLFLDHTNADYLLAPLIGAATWGSTQTVENSASVTSAPYGEPFYMAAKNFTTQATIIGTTIDFDDGLAPAWNQVVWSATLAGASTFLVQVEYYNTASSTWDLIPDAQIAGNSAGTSSSPIDIRNLNTLIYNQIRLVGNLACVAGDCPTLNYWTVEWAQGLDISGRVTAHDLTTNVTSGNVAVAVNGVLQVGKTGSIGASGLFTIANVTFFADDVIEVWIEGGGDASRAVAIAKYTGPGNFGGLSLAERWVTLGSASTTGQSLTLADLGLYDNSVSGDDDIFFDVEAGGDYNHCAPAAGWCYDSSLRVLADNTFQPSSVTAETLNMFDFRLEGYMHADQNTMKVGGSWRNLGGFTSGAGTVLFNATTSTRTIDNTSAATSTFYNVTFGEASTQATWSFSTAFVATGTVAMNYGTTSPGTQTMTLEGNLSIGASGTFQKGSATTTFSGSVARTWTDSTASKQDLGNILIDGTTKTLTLASSVRATNVTIGANDTLSLGGANTLNVLGYFENNNVLTALTGTVTFAATTTGQTINQGASSFYNLTFNGVGGAWRWLNTNATTSNDLTIATGTVTLPGGTLAVGGSFDNSGGTFTNNFGVVRFTATASGKNVRQNGSSFNDVTFAGAAGGWTFLDTNATTSNNFTITAGTPVLPSGVLEVGNNFDNTGSFTANGGTLKMTSTAIGETIRLSGSSLGALYIGGAGEFSILDTNATATGTVTFAAGTTTLPTGTFTVGGSFLTTNAFVASGGTVAFNGSSGTKTITTAASPFASVTVNGTGSFTFASNATTTANFTLTNANVFTVSSGLTLAVGGTYATVVGGASTTWAGATLALNSGTSYTLNTKTAGDDAYGTLRLAANTHIRSWGSSASVYDLDAAASLYSQNHGGVAGALNIYGAYARLSGADHWSAATDFDGTALGASSQRAVAVAFDAGATANFAVDSTLNIVGTTTATTTIDRIFSGNYGLTISSSTINASYYKFRNMDATGLNLIGSTTVTSLANGDFTLDVNGGSSMTVASTTIDTNPALQIFAVSFATSTGISSGYNVTETGVPASYWRFREHYGNYDGEAYDNDSANPGEIRWDDSSFAIEVSGTVYSDAGATLMGAPTCDGVTPVVRVKVDGVGNFAAACSATSSYYYVTGVAFSGDTVMTVYLDTAGSGVQGAIVTRSAAASLTGFNIYQHRVIVRHEDVTPMTIAAMDAYDFGDDPDVPFTVVVGGTNTLTVNPDNELWVWNAKTFVPGGNITLNSGGSGGTYDGTFHVDNDAIFTAEGEQAHSVGGRFVTDAGATFTAASSTFHFTATTTGKLITGVSLITFWKTNFSGVGGGWSIGQSMTVGDTFTVATGTVSGASNVTVNGTTLSGAGTIAMTAGTFTFSNGGTFGGLPDWSFFNLTFGSSSTATTTKTASSTVSVGGVLTVAANNVLEAGTSTTWLLTGVGTPLVLTGAFTAQNSVVRYAASAATNVTPAAYYQLDFGATGINTPTYTLASGSFTTASAFNVGMGSSTIYVNATTNDPTFTASGDVNIRASSTLVLSDSAAFTARRNWTDQGTTTPSGGTLTFDATTTGFTINTGSSALANVVFDNSAGGWTIAWSATTTGDFTLTAANTFTMASGTTLEVGGTFTNDVGGAATTWTGSTLYLNSGGLQTINTKTSGGDQYNILQVGASTHVRMWDSAATTHTVNSSGSLYSQDHDDVAGSLYIWGAYTRSSGTDYWSYMNDFDGTALGGSSRQANVRFYPGTTLTFSGGGLEVLGTSVASTTLDVQSAGSYSWNISGGSTTMQYYSVRNTDANGLNISGTPVVNQLSDGDFELATAGGTLIKVAGATIDANPLVTFFRNRFATTTAITGYNVTATGVSASAWRFNLHYGNLGGEYFDVDPGGDPGYLIWDDSAAQLTISGNVYADEGLTPIGSPTCNGVTQNVVLKVQGLGSYTSACDAGTGAYSISSVLYNPGDTITVYLDTDGGARAANIAYDPATNINNMHLYSNRVVVRHEQGTAVSNAAINQYDYDQDTDIPVQITGGNATFFAGTKLIVWNAKTFAPGGNVSLYANASTTLFDGTAHLYANAVWQAAGAQTHTIGGHFLAESGASITPANSTFTFTATTTGKTIAASTSLTFYNLAFDGASGNWNASGVGTTTNDLTIATGTVTLPSGVLAVGGSFDNSGGAFTHTSGTVKFTATAAGKNIRTSSSTFSDLLFAGSGGGWTFLDTNATTTGSVTITAGDVNLPAGIFEVGNHFDNQSGAFSAISSSTLKMTSTLTDRTLRFSGSYPGGLWVSASGTYQMLDTNATTTGNVLLGAGTTTLPYASLYVGGSFTSYGEFAAGTSTVTLFATSSGKTIDPGASSFYNLNVSGAGGGFTMSANATTTNTFTLTALGTYTQTSGTTLAVGSTFTNLVGGAGTTWAGSTIALNSGTSYTLNTKTAGGDAYGTLRLPANTHIAMWDSTVTSTVLDAASSIYSQDNGAVAGSLYIYGTYARTTGTDYWSYETDFDGTALGGSPRQANVRFAADASATFSGGATLHMIGVAAASTTVDRQASGNYAMTLDSANLNASYYQFGNLSSAGLNLAGATTITSMNNGAFTLDVESGSMITIASTTIDQNASGQIFTVSFATSSGISSGYNVTVSGTTGSSLTFASEYGNYASEAYDVDGATGCGSIRFTDSSCLISDQRTYRWRNDDGGEGALATEWYDQDWTKRQRVRLTTTGTTTLTNVQVKIDVPYDADMQADFDDLRFTDSSGTTSIASWTESVTSATATVWVKVPSLPAESFADVFMYYGNAGATASSSGTSTFIFFDDFEDGSLSEYTGDTSLFEQSTSFNYERTRGLDAAAGSETAQATDGIGQASAGVGRDTTFRFFQYIDMSSGGGNEPCFLFAMQAPITANQNYGVCLQPFGQDKITITENAAFNGRSDGSTLLVQKNVTYTTGWYEVVIDWRSFTDNIFVTVYDADGAVFATTSASDATYTSGGVGFTFWGMHGGWDIPSVRVYNSAVPTATFFTEQSDSGATWSAEENTALSNLGKDINARLRMTVKNSGAPLSDRNFRLQYAPKAASPNCEAVAGGNYVDVPTDTSGCGSEAACLKTSAEFINNASTTQLLAIPEGFTFTHGQMVEDPSNQTGNISLASSQFTEVEYNIQLTAFATQNAYCFRTTHAGTALDNYTRVPELTVLQGPSISNFSLNNNTNISLTEGTTTVIMATGTVTDLNGYEDIVNASSTFYRQSIAGARNCTADNNNCYQIATTSCSFSDCSGNSCTVSCSAPIYYFADPTDVGSTYEDDDWQAVLDVWDTSLTHANTSAAQELYTLQGLTTTSTLPYGSIVVGTDSGAANATTSVNNTGNSVLNLNVGGDDLYAGASRVTYDQQKYATSTFTYSACATCSTLSATSSPTYLPLQVSKATTTIWSPYKDIYWGINIPLGTAATTFSGFNLFQTAP